MSDVLKGRVVAVGQGGARLDWSLALIVTAIGVGGYLVGDRTDWSGGYGYDGRFYGELATNFPTAVFGHGSIVPPGLGPYHGPHLSGVDSYYVFRLLPSGVVWLGLHVFGLAPTHSHVVLLFALLAAAMFGLATFCWCRSADLLGLGTPAKVLGATALVVNFAVLKTGSYWPVLTDHAALGLGALSLYLWLRGATTWLAVCVVGACFTWPLHVPIGLLLLLFPCPADAREPLARAEPNRVPAERPGSLGLAVGVLAAAVALAALVYLEVRGYRNAEGTRRLPVFPLSAAVVGLYLVAVIGFLLPSYGWLVQAAREVRLRRVALSAGLIGAVLLAMTLLARRPGYNAHVLFKDAFWSTTLDPGLFLVVLACYYGPLILLLFAGLPRVVADLRALGPAMVGIVAIGLLGALTDQPREVVDAFPFLVLAGVLAARRVYPLNSAGLGAFFALSILLSRVWFHIGSLGFDVTKLQEFPAQRYFMATGTWTSPLTYGLQLGALIVTGVGLWFVAMRTRISSR